MKCNKIVSGLQSLAQLEAMSRFIAETSKEEEADAPSEHEHCGEQMVVVAEAASGTQTPAGLQQVPRELLRKILSWDGAVALRRTSKTLRKAVEEASVDVAVKSRSGVVFSRGGLLDALDSLGAVYCVRHLGLHACRLGDNEASLATELAAALRLNTTLVSLDLAWNSLGEDGWRVIAEALRVKTTLCSLKLDHNDIGVQTMRVLAEVLRVNSTITSLDLSNNHLREEGGRHLAETLRINTTLVSLKLDYNELEDEGGRAIADALRCNTTLSSLGLRVNQLGEQTAQAMSELMRYNTTLTSLKLDGNDPQAFRNALSDNTTLQFFTF